MVTSNNYPSCIPQTQRGDDVTQGGGDSRGVVGDESAWTWAVIGKHSWHKQSQNGDSETIANAARLTAKACPLAGDWMRSRRHQRGGWGRLTDTSWAEAVKRFAFRLQLFLDSNKTHFTCVYYQQCVSVAQGWANHGPQEARQAFQTGLPNSENYIDSKS